MKKLNKYIRQIESLAIRSKDATISKIELALNGEAYTQLRSAVPLDSRRKLGAFFTGEELAGIATRKFVTNYNEKLLIADRGGGCC